MRLTLEQARTRATGKLPGLIGMAFDELEPGRALAHLKIRDELMAPNGYLHAASIVALADTACGYGCLASLPEGATGFTTIELKTNFIGTARTGVVDCHAQLLHGGRTTQVWDATVNARDSGKTLALFRCTQIVLYANA
ncbi:MAG: PaaI family thioesterase [Gammaproteobacteria bacterium]|nr:PaaI family thioesterase [Gammaproteobacteria bacterium]